MLLAATVAVGTPSAAQDAADLVLRHGTVYPVSGPAIADGAVAVRGGRITYVGPDAGVAAHVGSATQVVELRGRAVTPGWIDAHSHLSGLGASLEITDLRGLQSFEGVVEEIRQAAAKAPPGTWVLGRGWDQNDWPANAAGERPMPTQEELSAAVPDHPVWLTRIDGHAALLNARAMAELGIAADVADPPGGRFLRDAGGKLTGVLIDSAMDLESRRPGPKPADLQRQLRAAAAESLGYGLTTVTEMGIGPEGFEAYRTLQSAGELPVRAALFWDGSRSDLPLRLAAGPWASDDHRLMLRGVKLYADGALGSRGAALLEPYADDAPNTGLLITPGEQLERVTRDAVAAGFQVGIHAIGDRGNLVALDAFEAAFGGAPKPEARCRIEHVQIVRHQDLERMGRLGVIASMQPTHATSDMPWVPARLGDHRLPRAYPWRTALNAGVRLALGSDFPVERVDPILGFYAAITRQDTLGQPAGGWLPDEVLTREEALRGFTLDAAWSLFLDGDVGTLEVGKRADLVVFERDPMTVPVEDVLSVRVDRTFVDGAEAYRREGSP
jgi:predicted amidohydrolase YtcJ